MKRCVILLMLVLTACSRSPDTRINACWEAVSRAHPLPPVTARWDSYWNNSAAYERRGEPMVDCMSAHGWKFNPAQPNCISSFDMTREAACYEANDPMSRVKYWLEKRSN